MIQKNVISLKERLQESYKYFWNTFPWASPNINILLHLFIYFVSYIHFFLNCLKVNSDKMSLLILQCVFSGTYSTSIKIRKLALKKHYYLIYITYSYLTNYPNNVPFNKRKSKIMHWIQLPHFISLL